jgi:hypothetical protein
MKVKQDLKGEIFHLQEGELELGSIARHNAKNLLPAKRTSK